MTTYDLGIGGDGQLGRMTALAAQNMGLRCAILGETPDSPGGQVADQVMGNYRNSADVVAFGRDVDALTIEFEDVDGDGLVTVENDGTTTVRPSGRIVVRMKDKLRQKAFVDGLGVPVGAYADVATVSDVADFAAVHGFPLVLKKRWGSYDGYGNAEIHDATEIEAAFAKLGSASRVYVEAFVPFVRELAVVLTTSFDGKIVTYPVVQTVQETGVCSYVVGPLPETIATLMATSYASTIARSLGYVGTMAIELFELADGTVRYNELATRVHNSGHWSQNAALTSQFENHVRAVMGWPLDPMPEMIPPFAMVNILGRGEAEILRLPDGYTEALGIPGCFIHWYGKRGSKLRRKLGHVNAVAMHPDDTYWDVLDRAQKARNLIGV